MGYDVHGVKNVVNYYTRKHKKVLNEFLVMI
jgi:hypothetical protein